jgi:hypothetical protein
VWRHAERTRDIELAIAGDEERRAAVEAHYERFLGPDATVWHEIVSDLVHIDVFMWRPSGERPMYTFATVGMSDRPMKLQRGAESVASPFAELMLCLPSDWPVPADEHSIAPWDDERAYMPIRTLKYLARMPHEYETWLGYGHSIPNGDPPELVPGSSTLAGWVVLPPVTLPSDFGSVPVLGGRVDIFGVWFLTAAEMEHKLEHGSDSLLDALEVGQVTELLAIDRPSTV